MIPIPQIVMFVAVLGLTGCATLSPMRPERALWIGSAVADVETSQSAFGRGASEINPLISGVCGSKTPGRACMYGLKAGAYALFAGLEEVIRKENHGRLPGWYKWVYWGLGIVAQGLVSIHNNGVAR